MDGDSEPIAKLSKLGLKSVLLRPWTGFADEQNWLIDQNRADVVMEKIRAQFGDVLRVAREQELLVYSQSLNEVPKRYTWDAAAAFNKFTVNFAATAFDAGIRPIAYAWSTGNLPGYGWKGAENPEHRNPNYATFLDSLVAHYAHFKEGVQASCDAGGGLGNNAYGALSMLDEPWWTWYVLRYRWDVQALARLGVRNLSIFLLEFGIDLQLVGRKIEEGAGWRNVPNMTAQTYASELAICDRELRKDNVSAYLFGHGPEGTWNAFGVDGETAIEEMERDSSYWVRNNRSKENEVPESTEQQYYTAPLSVELGQAVEGAPMRVVITGAPGALITWKTVFPRTESGYARVTDQFSPGTGMRVDARGKLVFDVQLPDGLVLDQEATALGRLEVREIAIPTGRVGEPLGWAFADPEFVIYQNPASAPNLPGPNPTQPGPTPKPTPNAKVALGDRWPIAIDRIFANDGKIQNLARINHEIVRWAKHETDELPADPE